MVTRQQVPCGGTVHHVDPNHDNNPSDGSNWELLCLYCHDEEPSKFEAYVRYGSRQASKGKAATHRPSVDLKANLEGSKD